jgi:hypothetical protein
MTDPVGLARRAAANRREIEAQAFDAVADAIESGRLTIRGTAEPEPVRDRLRDKARRSRSGERVYDPPKARRSTGDDADTEPIQVDDVADFRIEQL